MRFLVSVQTPESAPFRAAGDWLVDAEDREKALAVVKDRADHSWWPSGSTWTVSSGNEGQSGEPLPC